MTAPFMPRCGAFPTGRVRAFRNSVIEATMVAIAIGRDAEAAMTALGEPAPPTTLASDHFGS